MGTKQRPWNSAAYWLAPSDFLSLLSISSRITWPGGHHPNSVINQDNVPTDLPMGLSDGGNSLVQIVSFQVCTMLTKASQHSLQKWKERTNSTALSYEPNTLAQNIHIPHTIIINNIHRIMVNAQTCSQAKVMKVFSQLRFLSLRHL